MVLRRVSGGTGMRAEESSSSCVALRQFPPRTVPSGDFAGVVIGVLVVGDGVGAVSKSVSTHSETFPARPRNPCSFAGRAVAGARKGNLSSYSGITFSMAARLAPMRSAKLSVLLGGGQSKPHG